MGLHYSGTLLEFFAQHAPSLLDRIAELVARNQIEILGSGFYEPMLSVIPERDARGQVERMRTWCKQRFGSAPRGFWLTERVWEPDLARLLCELGHTYTMLDDNAFRFAGVRDSPLCGYYVAEKAGSPLGLVPIDKRLRYLAPFREPHETIDYLRHCMETSTRDVALCYGDAGEKFGLWPGTHEWVYGPGGKGGGWLERFFGALEEADRWLVTAPPGDWIATHGPSGRVYPPSSSYDEMMEWAQPLSLADDLDALRAQADRAGLGEVARCFLHGGIWSGFFVKYPEANRMHKRMVDVSARIAGAERYLRNIGPDALRSLDAAREALWRGQCNTAYWHGLYGGIYDSQLRGSVWSNLIEADRLSEIAVRGTGQWLDAEARDVDADLEAEIDLRNGLLHAVVKPSEGGVLTLLEHRATGTALTDVLARRPERYHREIARSGLPDLAPLLSFDDHDRVCLIDRFLRPDTGIDAWMRGEGELGTFVGARYALGGLRARGTGIAGEAWAWLRGDGEVNVDGSAEGIGAHLVKRFDVRAEASVLEVKWELSLDAPLSEPLDWGVEFNLAARAEDGGRCWVEIDGLRPVLHQDAKPGAIWSAHGARKLALVDLDSGVRTLVASSERVRIDRSPIWTVSRSAAGIERTFQGMAVMLRRRLAPGVTEAAWRVLVEFGEAT